MNINSRFLIGIAGVAVIVLVGCHRENPLLSEDPYELAQALYDIELQAEKSTNVVDTSEGVYLHCMRNWHVFDFPGQVSGACDTVFKTMTTLLNQHHPDKSISIDDLKDKRVFQKLHYPMESLHDSMGQDSHLYDARQSDKKSPLTSGALS